MKSTMFQRRREEQARPQVRRQAGSFIDGTHDRPSNEKPIIFVKMLRKDGKLLVNYSWGNGVRRAKLISPEKLIASAKDYQIYGNVPLHMRDQLAQAQKAAREPESVEGGTGTATAAVARKRAVGTDAFITDQDDTVKELPTDDVRLDDKLKNEHKLDQGMTAASKKAADISDVGHYVTLIQTDNNWLRLVPNHTTIKEFIQDNEHHLHDDFLMETNPDYVAPAKRFNVWGDDRVLMELLEDLLANGWTWVRPEDIGALTSAPILEAPDGRIYWHERYAVESGAEELLHGKTFSMEGAPENKVQEKEPVMPEGEGLDEESGAAPKKSSLSKQARDVHETGTINGVNYELTTWQERDRFHISLRNLDTDEDVFDLWDEDATAAVEEGFINPKRWLSSAVEYADHLGMLKQASKTKEEYWEQYRAKNHPDDPDLRPEDYVYGTNNHPGFWRAPHDRKRPVKGSTRKRAVDDLNTAPPEAAAPPAAPPAEVPAMTKYQYWTAEALSVVIEALSKISDFAENKAAQQAVAEMAEELNGRPKSTSQEPKAAARKRSNPGRALGERSNNLNSSSSMNPFETLANINELCEDAANHPNAMTFSQIAEWAEKQIASYEEQEGRNITGSQKQGTSSASYFTTNEETSKVLEGDKSVPDGRDKVENPGDIPTIDGAVMPEKLAAFTTNEDTSKILEGDHSIPDGRNKQEDKTGITYPATTMPSKLAAQDHAPHAFKPGQEMMAWNKQTQKQEKRPNPHFCKECGRKEDHPLHKQSSKLAGEVTTNKAINIAEGAADKLKALYLDSKQITQVNDTRPVREAVESIYQAMSMFEEAISTLSKQQKKEDAEEEAMEQATPGKKKSLKYLASLRLAARLKDAPPPRKG